jgi:uncharacterized membrane protein YgcG
MVDRRIRVVVLAWAALACAVLAPVGLAAGPAAAQSSSERISAYDVDIRVEASGSMVVTETIDYDFGAGQRHGIERQIPVRVGYDSRYERVYPLKIVSVAGSPGTPAQYKTKSAGRYETVRIGDPARTITGAHRYTIVYRVDAALNGFPDHDELYWNAVGTEWSVPIDRASVQVTAPAELTDVACFGGGGGSRLPCADATRTGAVAGFTQDGLGSSSGVTVVVGFRKGAVPEPVPVLDERWSAARAFAATPATVGVSLALVALVVAGFARLAWRTGRDRRFAGSPVDVAFATEGQEQAVGVLDRTETPVEFVPPDGLRPGQLGTLVDEVANTLDVTATIIDLAVRGYLRIDEIPKHGWFGKPDWTMTKLKEPQGLLAYEQALFSGLFKAGDSVQLSSLRNTFAARLATVQDALYDDVVAQGWFVGRPDKVRTRWRIIGAVALALAVTVAVLLAALTHVALVGLPLILGGALLLGGASRMPRRTGRGTGVLRRAQGFRRFIEESEKERARVAEQQHLFSEYLPYAIVFGATEKWARAFAGIDGELPQPTWYGGSDVFTAAAFSHSIDGFAVTTAGTITSTPAGSGSSGFSGGFSGGGGGGGGGGSW